MNIALAGIVILAGGESSRMGSPKALLTLSTGERLIEFHIRHAKHLNVPVMVADNGKGFCPPHSAHVIQDYLPLDADLENQGGKGAGALSAIAGAMDSLIANSGHLLVLSCDCLIPAHQLFDKLLAQITDENDEVIYLKGEKDYPLLALYRMDLLPQLKDYLGNGNRSVMKFLSDKKVKTVGLPREWINLANFNTMDEFELALTKIKRINHGLEANS